MSRNSDISDDRLTATRRTVLGAVGAGVGLTTLGAATGSAEGSDSDYWTVVALPDTQDYAAGETNGKPEVAQYAHDQTQWIVDNLDSENIAFVSHEGDVIHGDDGGEDGEIDDDKIDAQWQFMDDVMSRLDGQVPYSTVPGNHDWRVWWDRSSSIAKYKEYFGKSRYDDYDWFGGAGPTNGDENRDDLNTYQLFSAGGYDFIHLALDWEVPGSVDDPSTPLGWAQKVLDDHPDRAAIVTTHSYLRGDGDSVRRAETVQETNKDGNHAQTVWEEFISQNPQVFMVLSGHWHDVDDGEGHQVSTNEADLAVYEMMANYQFRTQGGYGLLRRIEFRPGEGEDGGPDRIQVRTYSPGTEEFETDADSEFGFDLDFDERFEVSSSEMLAGDADGDGDVDGDDVETVQRSISGEDVDIEEEAADVDGDGDIDIGDAVSIRNKSEGGS